MISETKECTAIGAAEWQMIVKLIFDVKVSVVPRRGQQCEERRAPSTSRLTSSKSVTILLCLPHSIPIYCM